MRAGEPGQPGQPGEPGQPGVGGGGTGGAGGHGGAGGRGGGVERQWHRHRGLVGYVFLVGVMLLSIFVYQRHQNSRFDARDQRSCQQRNDLARNQTVVLHDVSYLMTLETEEKEHHNQKVLLKLKAERAHLQARISSALPRKC